jgi:hypothetical protein
MAGKPWRKKWGSMKNSHAALISEESSEDDSVP